MPNGFQDDKSVEGSTTAGTSPGRNNASDDGRSYPKGGNQVKLPTAFDPQKGPMPPVA